LFHEGDPGETLYVIVSGQVNIQRVTAAGEILHLARRGRLDAFGELALIDGKPRMADAVTAAPCELLMLDRRSFLACVERSPRIALAVMACIADRLREAADDFEHFQTLDVLGRVAGALLELAHADPGTSTTAGSEVRIRVSHQALAQQVGSSRESVSRAISRLRQVGALASEGRLVVIRDASRLRRYL